MKKLKNFLCLALVVCLIVPAMMFLTACGDDSVISVKTMSELTAALSGEKETIKLTGDITATEKIEISRKVTFDLNGKTLTGNGCDGVFQVVENGDLTITGNGVVIANGVSDTSGEYAMVVWAKSTGKVTIKNGTFKQQQITGDSTQYDMIYASQNASITILGGYFESVTPRWTLNIKNDAKLTAQMIVKGGEFKGYNPANSQTDENASNNTNFVAEGYKSELKAGTEDVWVVSADAK